MKTPNAISYIIFFIALILMGVLHLAMPFIAILFSCLILKKLNFLKRKWMAVVIFLVIISAIFYGFAAFIKTAVEELPDIFNKAKPVVADFATKHDIELPYNDSDSFKNASVQFVKDRLDYLGNFAKLATKQFVVLVVGVVIAIGIFINPEIDPERNRHRIKENVYTVYSDLIAGKFSAFYKSFEMVMGAQLIISLINTVLTAIFVFSTSLPHPGFVIALTFLCGMLPIIGNIISNTVTVAIGFTVSPSFALWALVFLIAVHKLEYFLNSQIIGARIHNPMWLILTALIVGERLMGIPGLMLAPVVVSFIKLEAIHIPMGASLKKAA